jgi:hypothetical protein
MMEIDLTHSVARRVQGLTAVPAAGGVKQEEEKTPEDGAGPNEAGSGDRCGAIDSTTHPASTCGGAEAVGLGADKGSLSEAAALQLAQQVSNQLGQTPAAIAKHAVQKAIDLFI